MRRARLTLALLALSFAPIQKAYAAENDVQNLAAGDILHNEATALLNDKRYEEASRKFGEAFAKGHSPSSLYAQALVEKKMGHTKVALKLFRTYLDLPPNVKVTPEWRQRAEAEASACEKTVCRIDVRAQSFEVDGVRETGLVYTDPGSHRVVMRSGARETSRTASCAAGELVTVALEEKDAPGPMPPPTEQTERGSWLVPGIFAGVGVVGLGIGFGLGAASISAEKDAGTSFPLCTASNTSACQSTRDAEGRANGLATGAVVGQMIGIAALGGAVIATLVVRPWEEHAKAHVRIVPGLGGAAVVGTF